MKFLLKCSVKYLGNIFVGSVFLFTCLNVQAKIWLPSILSDSMVLQQDSEATIWGWTTGVSEKISVTGSWNNEKVTVEAYQ